jgi:hypothetical protein
MGVQAYPPGERPNPGWSTTLTLQGLGKGNPSTENRNLTNNFRLVRDSSIAERLYGRFAASFLIVFVLRLPIRLFASDCRSLLARFSLPIW